MQDKINPEMSDIDLGAPVRCAVEPWEARFTLFDVLAILIQRKRLIFGAALAGGVLSAVAALVLPNTYTATAVIMPPQKEQSAASMLVGQLGPLAAAAGADLGLKSPSDLYIGLLGSRTIADRLIQQFRLNDLYKTKTSAETRAKLKSHSRFSSGRDSLIRIEVEDTDPKRAAAMSNAYVSELDTQKRNLVVTEAGQRRSFLEKQLGEEKVELALAENAMKKTQQQTGVLDVSGQTQVAIASLAQLRAQITAGEVSLERLKMGATSGNPAVGQAEMELTALRAQLRKLDKSSGQGDPLVAATAIPQAGLDYARRLRDLKYHEFLFELLSKQYEAARIDESRAAPDLQVVDVALPPDQKSGPHRSLIVLLGCLLGTLLASVVSFISAIQSRAWPDHGCNVERGSAPLRS